MKPALAEELAKKVIQEAETSPTREHFRLYLLGLFIQLVHPLQGHDDAGLRNSNPSMEPQESPTGEVASLDQS